MKNTLYKLTRAFWRDVLFFGFVFFPLEGLDYSDLSQRDLIFFLIVSPLLAWHFWTSLKRYSRLNISSSSD